MCIQTFTFADDVGNQQLGCLWQKGHILSVGLNGFIHYLDEAKPDTPLRTLYGHQANITAVATDAAAGTIYAAGDDGTVSRSKVGGGETELFQPGHGNVVVDMIVDGDTLVSVSWDDTIRFTPKGAAGLAAKEDLPSQPFGLAVQGDQAAVACENHVALFKGGKQVFALDISYAGRSVSIHPSGGELTVGGKDGNAHVYTIDGATLTEKKALKLKGEGLATAYSPDGAYLACGDSKNMIKIFETATLEEYKPCVGLHAFRSHTASVNSLQWSPDSQHLASASLDTSIRVWSIAVPRNRIVIPAAHPTATVNSVKWLDGNTLISGGHDGCARQWKIVPHA